MAGPPYGPVFSLQIKRQSTQSKPELGQYRISYATEDTLTHSGNSGTCELYIDGAAYGCNMGGNDTYANINITEVKVDQDLGLEKRGYYKGEFDAILYYIAFFGATPVKRVITGGRFMAPMGNNGPASLNGTAPPPTFDRLAALTTGKWYWRPTVEQYLNDTMFSFQPCMVDDFMVFRTNGTYDLKPGAIQCDPIFQYLEWGYWDNTPWVFKNNRRFFP